MDILCYLFCGICIGLGEILPMNADVPGYLLSYMTGFDARQPLMLLLCHLSCLLVLTFQLRHKIAYLFREMRLASKPAKKRRRQPDLVAVLESKFLIVAAVPMVIMLFFRNSLFPSFDSLPMLALTLMFGGLILFLPQFLQSANRDARHVSRKDSIILGFFSGLAAIPGLSRTGFSLSVSSMRGLDKRFSLDCALLLSIAALVVFVILDCIALLQLGLGAITAALLLKSLLAAVGSMLASWIAYLILRFLSVNTGYGGFAYYSWGLGIFCFILYLMV